LLIDEEVQKNRKKSYGLFIFKKFRQNSQLDTNLLQNQMY